MALPVVNHDTLTVVEADRQHLIIVGTTQWYDWLSETTRFAYAGPAGNFVAYKESRDQGALYWRACRRRGGKLHRVYLGRDKHLTLDRLEDTANALSKRIADQEVSRIEPSVEVRFGPPTDHRLAEENEPAASGEVFQGRCLLQAKLTPPPGRFVDIPRPRLTQRLAEAVRHKLTLVLAPPGYGKTTLLGQWARSQANRIAWLTLDEADNEPLRFWTYFVAALPSHSSEASQALLDQLPSSGSEHEPFLVSLTNFLMASDDLLLVLDNYHAIQDRSINQGISFMLTHLSPQVHLVISSRTEPGVPFARLRAAGQLLELRVANLAFTRDETDAFLNQSMQLGLAADETQAIHDNTEGWATGLQLAAHSMKDADDVHRQAIAFAGNHRHVVDYLVGEVLDRQPEAIKAFLLRTSIVKSLNGPLCEAVSMLRSGEGQQTLERLERSNLFTFALDSAGSRYRYHHLFADCLRTQLEQRQPELAPDLHRRASEWYLAHGLLTEAVRHAIAAGDADLAGRLIEQNGGRLFKSGDVPTLLTLLASLPQDTVERRPWLCILEAIALLFCWRIDEAEARLQLVERNVACVSSTATGSEPPSETSRDLAGVGAAVQLIRANMASMTGNLRRAVALWRAVSEKAFEGNEAVGIIAERVRSGLALRYLLYGDSARASHFLNEARAANRGGGSPYENVLKLLLKAQIQIDKGQLHEAEWTLQEALPIALGDPSAIAATASVLAILSMVKYERNDIEGARGKAEQAEQLSSASPVVNHRLNAYHALCLVKLAEQDVEGAFDLIERTEELGHEKVSPAQLAWVSELRVRLWLKQGQVTVASQWAERSGIRLNRQLFGRPEAEQRAVARVLIAEGRPSDALIVTERLLRSAESSGRFGSAIGTLILSALAHEVLGETDAALNTLERALLLGEPEGYVRTFVDSGALLIVLLSKLVKIGTRSGAGRARSAPLKYVTNLIHALEAEAWPMRHKTDDADQAAFSLLSAREQQVLRLIGAGWSRSRIAKELVVSPHTVDSHLGSLFAKLGVHNRVEAVGRAKALRLL